MRNKKILVTGGAGYIGSHVVRQLGAAGENVITLDNLCTGFRKAVTAGELIVGETGDADLLERIFTEHDIDTIMHFAAHTIVPESVADPLKYYRNNPNTRSLRGVPAHVSRDDSAKAWPCHRTPH
jgi:UDP-glucose 4-epimerase